MKQKVFFSFDFDNDVFRVQQIRNIGVIEGEQRVAPNKWEELKRQGESSIKGWIDENINKSSCVIVLIGERTSDRKWVQYEIERAWNTGKGLLGIYIHNINCMREGKTNQGRNPFDGFTLNSGRNKLSEYVTCYNPSPYNAYQDIANNIDSWVKKAIKDRN